MGGFQSGERWNVTLTRAPATMNPNNLMTFPPPVPEIPAANVDQAAAYYVSTLGFTFDWGDDQGGIAGISKRELRKLFITNRSFRESYGNVGPILFWLNLNNRAEVDELFTQWKAAKAKIVSARRTNRGSYASLWPPILMATSSVSSMIFRSEM